MLFLLGVLLVVCASARQTVCEKARQEQAQLAAVTVNYGTLDAQSQRRLRILEATLRRCSTVRRLLRFCPFVLCLMFFPDRRPQARLPVALRRRRAAPRAAPCAPCAPLWLRVPPPPGLGRPQGPL